MIKANLFPFFRHGPGRDAADAAGGTMKIVRAENAGFCMGVSLALKGLDSELTDQGYVMRKNDVFVGSSNHIKNPPLDGVDRRIVTWGPIIHNKQVTDF